MARGSREVGVVEGVGELEEFCNGFHALIWRDGKIDPFEAELQEVLQGLLTGFQEWMSRFLVLLSNIRNWTRPPERTALLARDHEDVYGFNPLATAAD